MADANEKTFIKRVVYLNGGRYQSHKRS